MTKKLQSITLSGEKRGDIWMPCVECTKEFDVTFTTKHDPFREDWTGLEDALNFITNDGDFRFCELSDLWGSARYWDDQNNVWITKDLKFNFDAKIFEGYVNHEYL